jgi:sugar lactone lactonase YvrE
MNFKVISRNRQILGEGLSIQRDDSHIFWVDIIGNALTRMDLFSGKQTNVTIFKFPSCTFCDDKNEVFVAHQGGISLMDRDFKSSKKCVEWFDSESGLRCNDGTMDEYGNIWMSTMSVSHEKNCASIWFWNRRSHPKLVVDNLTIPNSIAVDTHRARLYFADSYTNVIYRANYSIRDGSLGSIREFHKSQVGTPDGSTLDKYGNLWNTRWGGGCVLKISPGGIEQLQIMTPVQWPTSCVLSKDEKTLFFTSAAESSESLEGHTFKLSL